MRGWLRDTGAVDLGDDAAWLRRTWLRGIPSQRQEQRFDRLIAAFGSKMERPPKKGGLSFWISPRRRPESARTAFRNPAPRPDRPGGAAGRPQPGRNARAARGGSRAPSAESRLLAQSRRRRGQRG